MSATELLERWRSDLESWAIPDEILAATPESPWVLPRQHFIARAQAPRADLASPSYRRAWEALASPGSVLDVGAGAGAACLPLVPRATAIAAVDSDQELLNVFVGNAKRLGTAAFAIHGRWPDVAGEVEPADVVTCHHVLYNVADLGPFVVALTSHARRLVVVELTVRHPLTALNPLWERFHGLVRPKVPTAYDVLAVLKELGLAPCHQVWSRSGRLRPRNLRGHGRGDKAPALSRSRPGRRGRLGLARARGRERPGCRPRDDLVGRVRLMTW